MPAYNAERYILSAISSVLHQTFSNFELVVLNDGSTDTTQELIDSIQDPRIRSFKNDSNMGLAITRNRLMLAARCNYLAILDSDDLADEDRLEKQLNFLKKNPGFGLISSGCQLIDGLGEPIGSLINKLPAGLIPSSLLFRNYFLQSSVLINRQVLPELSYDLSFPPAEDYELWCRIADAAPVYSLPESLIKYRIHGNNISLVRKDLLAANISNVLVMRLAKLGIQPDQREMSLHAQFGNYSYSARPGEMLHWLLKLKKSNATEKVYSIAAFNTSLLMHWIEFLTCSAGITRLKKVRYLITGALAFKRGGLFTLLALKGMLKIIVLPVLSHPLPVD